MYRKRANYPIQIDAFDKGAGPLCCFNGHFEHAVHVHVVAFDGLGGGQIWRRPADQNAFVQLPFQR